MTPPLDDARTEPLPPSGEQHSIRSGAHEAVVTGIGATIRSYAVGGRPVLEAFGLAEIPPGGHGQQLLPWPNRIASGRWSWGGRDLQLPLTEVALGNASHGLVRWLPWQVTARTESAITLETMVGAQPGWPFLLGCSATFAVSDADGLAVRLTGTNLGADPCPWGAGSHPYLAVPGGVDAATITVSAGSYLLLDERNLPTGRAPVAGTDRLLDGAPIGDRRLDTAYTDLERDADGGVTVTVDAADGGRTTMRGDASVRWMQVFTGDTVGGSYRRSALAVEPMTCPPDAFNSHEDLVLLGPGETAAMSWSIRLEPSPGR